MKRIPQAARLAVVVVLAALLVITAGCGDSADQLVGRWQPKAVPGTAFPAESDPNAQEISFDTNGRWSAFDGCYEVSGGYDLDEESGGFQGSSEIHGGAGCDGQISYGLLLAEADDVSFPGGGTAEFRSKSGEVVLVLSRVEDDDS